MTYFLTLFLTSNICSLSPRLLQNGWLKPWTTISFISTLPWWYCENYYFQLSNIYLPRPWPRTPYLYIQLPNWHLFLWLNSISKLTSPKLNSGSSPPALPTQKSSSFQLLVMPSCSDQIPGVSLDSFLSHIPNQIHQQILWFYLQTRSIIKTLPSPLSGELLIKYKPACGFLLNQSCFIFWQHSYSLHSLLTSLQLQLHQPLLVEGFAGTAFLLRFLSASYWQASLPNSQCLAQMSFFCEALLTGVLNNVSCSHHSHFPFSALFFSKTLSSHFWHAVYFALSLSCFMCPPRPSSFRLALSWRCWIYLPCSLLSPALIIVLTLDRCSLNLVKFTFLSSLFCAFLKIFFIFQL